MFFYMLNGSPFGFLSVGMFGDGSGAAPSITFQAEQNLGFYRQGSATLGLAVSGVGVARFYSPGTNDFGIATLQANKSITFQPSGTGAVVLSDGTNSYKASLWTGYNYSSAELYFAANQSGSAAITHAMVLSGNGGVNIGSILAAPPSDGLVVKGHVLLGGLTTDGTGVLQFAAATTAAGGITFGTDINLFRSGGGQLNLAPVGTNGSMSLAVYYADAGSAQTISGYFGAVGAAGNLATGSLVGDSVVRSQNNLLLASGGGTIALTLDTSRNASFAGYVKPNLVTVASLPAAAAGNKGARLHVSDANATTFASIVAGGGANIVPVYSDGTNWRIG